jgi:hypothetical protein
MLPKTATNSLAALGVPSTDALAGNTWMAAVEADALQVPKQ